MGAPLTLARCALVLQRCELEMRRREIAPKLVGLCGSSRELRLALLQSERRVDARVARLEATRGKHQRRVRAGVGAASTRALRPQA